LVAGKVDEARPLGEQIEPLLSLFAPGTYCLRYTPATFVSICGYLSANHELLNYYPGDELNLVCTQARESLNEERVAFYRSQIRAQERPIVLTASARETWCEFVIDGHHKLEAYNEERVKPAILGIVRWQAPAISLKEGLSFLPRGHRGVKEYRRMKGYRAK
jgi:hypothetical protein